MIYTTAAEARANGAKVYLSGKPCPAGHVAFRRVGNSGCVECLRVRDASRVRPKNRYKPEKYQQNREATLQKMSLYRLGRRSERPWQLPVTTARYRAAKKGREFSLSFDWAKQRWTGSCELTGLPFDLKCSKHGGSPFSPSIDRIDNRLGYTPENSRFVLHCINNFKGELTDEQMIAVARALLTSSSA